MESTGLRTVVITGAASGIGERLARRLASAERLVLLDSDEERLAALCADLGPAAVPVVVDLADRSALRVVCDRWAAELSTVDLLVLNAGIGLVGRYNEVSDADVDHVLDVNLRAPMVLARALLTAVVRARGRIVVMSSVSGLVGSAGQVAYCASKYGIRGFADALRAELAGTGVSVTTVHPSGVRTRMADLARIGARTPAAAVAANRRVAGRHLTQDPDDVAAQIIVAARRRRSRVLIGAGSVVVDLVTRLSPRLAGALAVRFDSTGRSPHDTPLG